MNGTPDAKNIVFRATQAGLTKVKVTYTREGQPPAHSQPVEFTAYTLELALRWTTPLEPLVLLCNETVTFTTRLTGDPGTPLLPMDDLNWGSRPVRWHVKKPGQAEATLPGTQTEYALNEPIVGQYEIWADFTVNPTIASDHKSVLKRVQVSISASPEYALVESTKNVDGNPIRLAASVTCSYPLHGQFTWSVVQGGGEFGKITDNAGDQLDTTVNGTAQANEIVFRASQPGVTKVKATYSVNGQTFQSPPVEFISYTGRLKVTSTPTDPVVWYNEVITYTARFTGDPGTPDDPNDDRDWGEKPATWYITKPGDTEPIVVENQETYTLTDQMAGEYTVKARIVINPIYEKQRPGTKQEVQIIVPVRPENNDGKPAQICLRPQGGNAPGFEVLADLIGQKPGDSIEWHLNSTNGPTVTTAPNETKRLLVPLPSTNAGFGQKRLYAFAKNGNGFVGTPDSVDIKLFFDRDRNDHPVQEETVIGPNGDPMTVQGEEKDWPNWFYYWREAAVPRLNEFGYTTSYSDGVTLLGYHWIGSRGADTLWRHGLATADWVYDALTGTWGYNTPSGKKIVQLPDLPRGTSDLNYFIGIHACEKRVQHELLHSELDAECTSTTDQDRDGLLDAKEAACGSVVGVYYVIDVVNQIVLVFPKDSFGLLNLHPELRQTYQNYPDQECYCRLKETELKTAWVGVPSADWAYPGKQTSIPDWGTPLPTP